MVAAEKKRKAAAAGRLKKTQKRRKVTVSLKSPPEQTAATTRGGGAADRGGSNPPGGAAGTATATGGARAGGVSTSAGQGAIKRAIRDYMEKVGVDGYDKELMSQASGQSDKRTDWENIWQLAMALPGLQVFGWTKEGGAHMMTVHSLARYACLASDAEESLQGRTIGMV